MLKRILQKTLNIIYLIHALMQVGDALFTYMGVKFYGIAAEGNPLLVALFHKIGVVPTLILVKVIALLVILFLYRQKRFKESFPFLLLNLLITLVYIGVVALWGIVLFR